MSINSPARTAKNGAHPTRHRPHCTHEPGEIAPCYGGSDGFPLRAYRRLEDAIDIARHPSAIHYREPRAR